MQCGNTQHTESTSAAALFQSWKKSQEKFVANTLLGLRPLQFSLMWDTLVSSTAKLMPKHHNIDGPVQYSRVLFLFLFIWYLIIMYVICICLKIIWP